MTPFAARRRMASRVEAGSQFWPRLSVVPSTSRRTARTLAGVDQLPGTTGAAPRFFSSMSAP